MGHVDVPNHDEDDIFPERDVENQEWDQHNHENDRVRQHYPRAERTVWVQQRPRPPPQGQLYNPPFALPPSNFWISRPAAQAYRQPRSQPLYNHHICLMETTPIGVSIPIVRWSHEGPRQGESLRFRSPLIFSLVPNPPLFYPQRLRFQNIPPPMPLQLQSPDCLSFMSRRNRIPRSIYHYRPWPTYRYRPRPPVINIASSQLMRSQSRKNRLNQRHRTTNNPQQVKESDEDKDNDDIGEPRDKCEAYKDLHYDKDSDDDDDDDVNSNNQDSPNMQIVF